MIFKIEIIFLLLCQFNTKNKISWKKKERNYIVELRELLKTWHKMAKSTIKDS